MARLNFDDSNVAQDLDKLSRQELDQLPFGVIKVDADGLVREYNKAEGEIVNRNPTDTYGKNFFFEVAPCTSMEDFWGRFRDGVQQGRLDTEFDYIFDYRMYPTDVRVKMRASSESKRYWILVKRL